MENRPFIAIWLTQHGRFLYQCDAEHTQDECFETVQAALDNISELLDNETISLDSTNKVFILNTLTGETHEYHFFEQPRKFLWQAK